VNVLFRSVQIIAEGQGKEHNKERVRFIPIGRESLFELETQLYLSFDLIYIVEKQLTEFLDRNSEIKRMLNGSINFLEK
jgi:four helix bundle protein